MKLTKLSVLVFLMGAIVFSGCKDKPAKELIINNWKFTEISGTAADLIPDSIKKKIYANATMNFNKDGSYEQAGGIDNETRKGVYSLSDDGKTIYSIDESKNTDTMVILQISKDKMVVSPKIEGNSGMLRLTMIPK